MVAASSKIKELQSNSEQDINALFDRITNQGIQYLDFRFTDSRGLWHHMSVKTTSIDADMIANGITFDGSSIKGWKEIDDSDMTLKPDISHVVNDPFSESPTLIVFCNIHDPKDETPYTRDPRSIALRAEQFLRQSKVADKAYFGPEPEFFIFDKVEFDCNAQNAFYRIHSAEGSYTNNQTFKGIDQPTLSHRPLPKGGYFPVPPIDSEHNLRAKMLSTLADMGVAGEKHHHEVAAGQHEIGFSYDSLTRTADNLQIFKYVVHNVAVENGKTATFMPKPIFGDNGSGMHVHQSLWLNDAPIFPGDKYANLSESALYYIGGILKHARALNAFTNPTTNSYKRLVPGYEAPVYLAYSARNRSAAVRIPHILNPKARRIEIRFPDPSSNPYLALSAMLMAGIDGILNKIHPGEAMDKNLYEFKPHELTPDIIMSGSLKEALMALDQDREFLKRGDVFTDEQIEAYIALKNEEVLAVTEVPHPKEFSLYYSL
ncbi:type I glutamate--ammonia ligase [Candidatus Nucleicultrix amoebiphila]|jgi:glutamine synthetase|uniref:type I glutamate--ammonia ligase n=1 Tax=Candidatus Nucleicultrix amoebiphila TaxID=1509244 RepID=UPI000A2703A3|nr:type I glutamate--ammonia ligase [Candidatus Nucleicultrix amoebiphila]